MNWKAYWIVPKSDEPKEIQGYLEKLFSSMGRNHPEPSLMTGFAVVENGDTSQSICVISSNFEKTARSTARLLAAAPDLLDACKLIQLSVTRSGPDEIKKSLNKITKAIDKAINGSSTGKPAS